MPGPGPHMMYALLSGVGLTSVSGGRFDPHHSLTYAINAFFGPDLGSFSQWLASIIAPGSSAASPISSFIHHPLYYVLILGFPLSILYSHISKTLVRTGVLLSYSGEALTRLQCFLLIFAGSLSHFFLDHLFEENGKTPMYTWILSTGWWDTSGAPIYPDAVVVVGILCACLIGGFVYVNRVRSIPIRTLIHQQLTVILVTATLYSLWCSSQVYLVDPRRPAVGEEADLGVIVFLAIYLFFPHYLCIMSMNKKMAESELIPLYQH